MNGIDPSLANQTAKTRSLTSQKIDINYPQNSRDDHVIPVEGVTSLIESETDSSIRVSPRFFSLARPPTAVT